MDFAQLIFVQALDGLVYAMLLFLVASGLTLVFGMMGVLNFAHGALYMLGAYFSYTILKITGNFWLSLLVAPLFVGIIGVAIERFLLRKIYTFGHAHELLLTFGIAYIVGELVKWIWGDEPLLVTVPKVLNGTVLLFGIVYPTYRLFIMVVSFLVFIVLFLIFYKTRMGIIVRAAVSNSKAVNALGVNVPIVFMALFGAGAVLAGLAGVIAGDRKSVV